MMFCYKKDVFSLKYEMFHFDPKMLNWIGNRLSHQDEPPNEPMANFLFATLYVYTLE